MASLNEKHQRLIYLITYSRVNTAIFNTRQRFADAVIEAWRNAGVRLQHWVVSMEGHAITDSEQEMNEYHYHMAVKLTKKARWLQIRNYLDHKYGIKLTLVTYIIRTIVHIGMLPKKTHNHVIHIIIQICRQGQGLKTQ